MRVRPPSAPVSNSSSRKFGSEGSRKQSGHGSEQLPSALGQGRACGPDLWVRLLHPQEEDPPRHRRRAAVRSPRPPAQAPSPQYNWAQSGFIASLKKRSQNNKREARGSEDAANLQRSHLRQTRFYLRSICGLHKGDEIPTQEHTDPSSASNLWGLELPSRTRIKDISTSLAGRLACNKPSVNVRCDFHQQHYY